MQLLNISILPEGVLGWSLLIIIFVLLILFVTVLNPRAKRNTHSHGDLLDSNKPDVFQIVKRKAFQQANIWNEKKSHEDMGTTVYTSFNPETNEAVVVRLVHSNDCVTEIERTTYFVHVPEVKDEHIEESKEKLDDAVDNGIEAFNDIISVNSDTFIDSGELIGMMHVLQNVKENTGETVLFTDSKLGFKAVEEKLYHEGYEKT